MKQVLTDKERERYSRQISADGWGEQGQQKLKSATVFVAGCGGLGSPVLSYLAAAGVGTLRICDDGDLELSNLNRQVLYTTNEIGRQKTDRAAQRLRGLNPEILVEPICARISDGNAAELIGSVDLIIDCLDNFATREVLNRYSVEVNIPFLHAGVAGMAGQLLLLHPPLTGCLACVIPPGIPEYESPPPVIGAAPGVMGALQAMEALKYLTGVGISDAGIMTIWDGETNTFDKVKVERDPACPICGNSV